MEARALSIFETKIADFKIEDEPFYSDICSVVNRIPEQLDDDKNMAKVLGNTSSVSANQCRIKLHSNPTKDYEYEDDQWISVREEVKSALNSAVRIYLEMHYTEKWILKKDLQLRDLWVVRYKEGDYQSYHTHPYAVLSGVMFLEVPSQIHQTKNFPDGYLVYLNDGVYDETTLRLNKCYFVKPDVGTLVIAPASVGHMVYPYKGPGTRTIVSMNWSENILWNFPPDKGTGKFTVSGPNSKLYELNEIGQAK